MQEIIADLCKCSNDASNQRLGFRVGVLSSGGNLLNGEGTRRIFIFGYCYRTAQRNIPIHEGQGPNNSVRVFIFTTLWS